MLRVLRVSRRCLFPLSVLFAVGGCAADRVTGDEGSTTVTEQVVVTDLGPLSVGASRRLTAHVVRGGRDTTIATDVVWTSENPSVATISDGNLLTAISSGETYVVADDRKGKKGRGLIKVNGPSVSAVRVNPTAISLAPGRSTGVTVEILDASGTPITGKTITWGSSDTTVVVVGSGIVTARRTGTASIAASVDGITGTAQVVVADAAVATIAVTLNAGSIAVGQQTTAVAVLRDASNNVLSGRSVGWGSSNTAVATVDANGVVRGIGVGTTTVVASSEGITGSATVTVTPQLVASITLSPTVVTTGVGQTVGVTATLRDNAGNVVTGRTPTWTSASTAIATVSASGGITGVAAGSTTVTASLDGVSAPVAVTVTAPGSNTMSMTPTSASVVAGQSVQLTATLRDPQGNPVATTFTWSSSNTSVATVNASGLVQGVATGTASIVARSADNLSASATITVTPVPVASVTLSPTSLSLVAGQSGTIAATCRDAAGNALAGRTVTWTSSATGIATVNAVGQVTAVAAGSATMTATCEGRTATAAVTVSPVPVASVTVTPGSSILNVGATLQLTATVRDAAGNTLTGRTVTWSSTAAATVSTSGLVTGVAAGTATITATSEGRSGTATITVQAPPPPAVGEPTYSAGVDQLVMEDGFDTFGTIDDRHRELQRLRQTEGWNTHRPFVSDNRMVDWPAAGSTFYTMHQILSPGMNGGGRALRSQYLVSTENQSSTWLTWPMARKYAVDSSTTVVSYMLRITTPTWQISYPGFKFFEMWHANGTTRTQFSVGGPAGSERWHVNPESRGTFANQPAGTTTWSQVRDGQWHRFTFMFKPAVQFGDTRGIARMWIDGNKVLDLSAQGAAEGYCTLAEVQQLGTQPIYFLKWPDVLNTNPFTIGIMDFDDFRWWVER